MCPPSFSNNLNSLHNQMDIRLKRQCYQQFLKWSGWIPFAIFTAQYKLSIPQPAWVCFRQCKSPILGTLRLTVIIDLNVSLSTLMNMSAKSQTEGWNRELLGLLGKWIVNHRPGNTTVYQTKRTRVEGINGNAFCWYSFKLRSIISARILSLDAILAQPLQMQDLNWTS